jgi:hypothetical protein
MLYRLERSNEQQHILVTLVGFWSSAEFIEFCFDRKTSTASKTSLLFLAFSVKKSRGKARAKKRKMICTLETTMHRIKRLQHQAVVARGGREGGD